ncbi:hypothetical protein [Roseibium sediminicola]|uniref:Nucleoside 2-deoxyribosyltransferase n=1 Tax=Roseibium sediminicola TaxID=2933272 RepID=A0ABT0GVY5_9HYPH|nr:hypothetical protein [Roseibium sp. CAU 1639]MCK7613380.1 hypothetical protein [Roseibium sp. CAU 1639]
MANTLQSAQRHIVICGSMSTLDLMERLAGQLRRDGHTVSTPVPEEAGFDWTALSPMQAVARKKAFLSDYFEVIRRGDVVLIANTEKHDIPGYVGANTLMEAACGYALRKPVYFLHDIGDQPCRLEAAAVSSGVLNGDLERLFKLLDQNAD